MQINISVLAANKASATSKAGKPYQLIELAYKNNSFQGKVESVKINQYSPLYSVVAGMKAGDSFEVTKEKDDNGFWQWTKATQAAPGSVTETAPAGASKSNVTQVKSTYETPAEREKKQRYIIKQSSISNAVALLTSNSKSSPSVEDTLSVAQQFYSWVVNDSLEEVSKDILSLPNDLPEVD